MKYTFILVTAILTLFLAHSGAAGVEPWADSKMPVKGGLVVWFDATRAWGKQLAPHDGKLAEWLDASGNGRHAKQAKDEARPTRLPVGQAAVVRFDGLDDHLRSAKKAGELKEFTLFVVAAPRQNLGGFRGLVALNAEGQKDYTSGLNLDLGPEGTPRFSSVNVEGRGCGGAKNLRKGDSPLGQLRTLEVTGDAKAVRLAVDGKAEGERPREPGAISMEEITLGARYYNNGPGAQYAQGFGRCDVAEVLLFDRVLKEEEVKKVRAYLDAKYGAIKDTLPSDGETLVTVKDPPPVQMLVPGFTVRELPVDLTNVNNVKYRADGTLVALGYDGRIWHLTDTDGDGVEDKATLYWENKGGLRSTIGMDLTPAGYKHGDGVFVTGKTKCVLILDTDKDGKGDKEIEIAGGWKESFHQVDGLGVAVDPKDGSVYYGRGTYNFADPLLRDKDGKPQYSIKDESGAIVRVSPDFKKREVVATGIRFPVGIHFNKAGDLFCTDQEGATWVPNGNPLDELLHIDLKKVRHYGFPPRHPKHLPDVIDEPSVFDYGPQHQSTCGFCFNEPVKEGGPEFGAKSWAGDAIVTGESRGKLYRTQLVKTAAGYVARNQIIACLSMLTIDCCVAPDGSLVVACHSGGPDWGSGPTGKGKLFKISYTDKEHPQPVLAYPSGPREVRVEFDRPVDPQLLRDVLAKTKLTAGKYARAGDRFETIWPGYAVVQAQKVAPRVNVPVHSAQLTPDRRTLVLATDPLNAAVHYALVLPGVGRPPKDRTPKGAIPQYPEIELDFDLSGVEAAWKSKDGKAAWSGWLPSLDLAVSRAFTKGSATHDKFWDVLTPDGALTLKTQLNLTDMLRPAVQPGSKLDYEYPAEKVTVSFGSTEHAVVTTPAAKPYHLYQNSPHTVAGFSLEPKRGEAVPLQVELTVTRPKPAMRVTYSTAEDKTPRALQLHRQLLPWADVNAELGKPVVLPPPKELEGGSWARGRKVFFGEKAACSKCHSVSAQGGDIGPDLTNLVHRDYASVMRDVAQPSFAINPDHVASVVRLTDDRTITGVVRTVNGKLHIGDKDGKVTVVDKNDVAEMRPSPISVMPDDLLKKLSPEETRDLLTFLLTRGPHMPEDYAGAEKRPKPRTVAEVKAVLAGAPTPPEKVRPIRVVLVAGAKDHGKGEHDYPAWLNAWGELLAAGESIEVVKAMEWPEKEEFQKADAMLFYQHGAWDARRAADVDAFLERGGGLVYVHWAVDGGKNADEFAKRIGLAAKLIKFRHGPLDLTFDGEKKHPVLRNFDKLKLVDESYWKMTGELPKERVLGWGKEDNEPQPLFWSLERGKGRVFVSIPGHYSWTFDDPLFRVLLLRGVAWSAKEPVDRFNDLVWPGADVAK